MKKTIAALLAGLCLLVALGARADTLSGEEIDRFMSSMEALFASKTVSGQFESVWSDPSEIPDYPGSLMPSELTVMLSDGIGEGVFEDIIATHGFDSSESWGSIGDRVLLALMSLEVGADGPSLQAKLARMAQEIESNPQFSDAQRRRLQQMIDRTLQILERVARVPQSDREAVQPHMDELKQVLNYQVEN